MLGTQLVLSYCILDEWTADRERRLNCKSGDLDLRFDFHSGSACWPWGNPYLPDSHGVKVNSDAESSLECEPLWVWMWCWVWPYSLGTEHAEGSEY